MPKHKIVKFIDGQAKIYIVKDMDSYLPLEDSKTLFVNPDLTQVRGLPPEFWNAKDGKIVPLGNKEIQMVIKRQSTHLSGHISEVMREKKKVKIFASLFIITAIGLIASIML